MKRYYLEENIREALIEQFKILKNTKLHEMWRVAFPICLRSAARMERRSLQAWFCGFTPAAKLGMWWTLHDETVTLHGTQGKPPVVDRLFELLLWLQSEAEVVVEPGKITGNLTLLTTATESYSY